MTEDVLTGTFDFLAEVVAARTFSTDEVVTGTFFVREVFFCWWKFLGLQHSFFSCLHY